MWITCVGTTGVVSCRHHAAYAAYRSPSASRPWRPSWAAAYVYAVPYQSPIATCGACAAQTHAQ